MFNWLKRLWHGKDSSLAEKRRSEPEGGIERKGSSKRKEAGVKPKASSAKRRQPSKSKLSSKDGGSERPRKGQQGKTNASSSQPKSVGSLKQVGRKGKGQSNKSKKQS